MKRTIDTIRGSIEDWAERRGCPCIVNDGTYEEPCTGCYFGCEYCGEKIICILPDWILFLAIKYYAWREYKYWEKEGEKLPPPPSGRKDEG